MPLSLHAAAAIVRHDARPYEPDPAREVYYRELLAPFGIEADDEMLKRSPNIGIWELAVDALTAMSQPVTDTDLLILSYGLPDGFPLKTTANHLNLLLGGTSLSFAVCEQGLHSPFTALKIGDAFARSGRCSSFALVVCEQTTLPYYDPLVHDTPLTDSAAWLQFSGGDGWQFRQGRAAGTAESLGPIVATLLADQAGGRALVVAGPWVNKQELEGAVTPVHYVAPGSYCTSVWLDLARHHETWAETYDVLVLCDTDPRTGRGSTALLRKTP